MTKKQVKKQPAAAETAKKQQAPKEEEKQQPKTLLGVSLPLPPAPQPTQAADPSYQPKPFDLSRKCATLSTQGLPKSKKPWKALS